MVLGVFNLFGIIPGLPWLTGNKPSHIHSFRIRNRGFRGRHCFIAGVYIIALYGPRRDSIPNLFSLLVINTTTILSEFLKISSQINRRCVDLLNSYYFMRTNSPTVFGDRWITCPPSPFRSRYRT
jgi:hypothetical protein